MVNNNLRKYLNNPLLQNMAVYAASNGIAAAMPFLVFPVVAYYLSTEEFGLVTNYLVLIQVLGVFTGLSTASYFAVEYHRAGANLKSTLSNIHYFNFTLFLIVGTVIIFSNKYITSITQLKTTWILLALISIPFSNFMHLFLDRLRMEERAKVFGIFNTSSSVLSALLTLLFIVFLGMGWRGRIYGLFLATFLGGMVAIILNARYIGKFHKPDLSQMKSFLVFGLPLLPHNLSIWLRTGFEKIFITESVSLASNGVYSFAVSITLIFTLLGGAFFSAFSPYVYRILSSAETYNEIDRLKTKIGIVRKSYIFLAAYLGLLFFGFLGSYLIIEMFFEEKYSEAIIYLPFLLTYNFFNTCYIFVSMFVYYSKSTRYLGLITIFSALIQVSLMMFLVKLIGPIGAAISAMMVSILTLVTVYYYSNKVYPMPWLDFHKLFQRL